MSQTSEQSEVHHAHERRCWVRLTQVCNNRCLFCHDSGLHTGRMGDFDELIEEMQRGRAEGAQRLILSGGEPTVHPRFLDFVAAAKEMGYRWVQTVSNGRMFAYGAFVRRCIDAGLDEVTLSLHGHTAELHDRLTGVPGGFDQSLRGLTQLLASGRLIVSVDVVLNALNLPVLPELIRFYLDRGVREFDLLWLVPFGRAWENREQLFVTDPGRLGTLRQAVDLCRERGAVVWTNRLPASLLEGCESLMQEPEKILDEVRGRRADFGRWIDDGVSMPCLDAQRCPHCFMAGFCAELERILRGLRRGRLDGVLLDAAPSETWPRSVQRARRVVIRAARSEDAAAVARALPDEGQQHIEAWIQQPPDGDPAALDWGPGRKKLVRVVSGSPGCIDALLGRCSAALGLVINEETCGRLASWAPAVERRAGGVDLIWDPDYLPDRPPDQILAPLSGAGVSLVDLPRCLLPEGAAAAGTQPWESALFTAGKGVDLDVFSSHFLRHRYRVFSARCAHCGLRVDCPGLSIHWARRYGFALLRPTGPGSSSST